MSASAERGTVVRAERDGDGHPIDEVIDAAFRAAPHASGAEAQIVRALRARRALSLSMVAASPSGEIVGHVAASRVSIADGSTGWFGIGPLSVRPSHQRRGIGSRLMESVLERLQHRGAAGCVLVGDPRFYVRFGFHTEPRLSLPGVPQEYLLELPFGAARPRGVVTYDEAFGVAPVRVRRVAEPAAALREDLALLIIDAVHGGASVGFLAPLSHDAARTYADEVLAAVPHQVTLWVAEEGDRVVGSVQLVPCRKDNGRHRAEVQKLQVLSTHQGRGLSGVLMRALEAHARATGLTLLHLDTIAGSRAESVYQHLGWRKSGEIPEYAAMPDGELRATAVYYKQLGT